MGVIWREKIKIELIILLLMENGKGFYKMYEWSDVVSDYYFGIVNIMFKLM